MKTFTLLVKTQNFTDKVKRSIVDLTTYVINYADYSTFILEQLGVYRYRQFNMCVLGHEKPNDFIGLLSARDPQQSFFCNDKSQQINTEEINQAYNHPEEYAIVLYNCFQ